MTVRKLPVLDRTPKPCLHKRGHHVHGTTVAYSKDGCRCLPCSEASRDYSYHRRLDAEEGRPRTIDIAPARAHLRALRKRGMGLRRISELSGIDYRALGRLSDATRSGKVITPRLSEAILAIALSPYPRARVSALSTTRRMQALMCAGWNVQQLTDHSGLSYSTVRFLANGKQDLTEHFVVERVEKLLKDLWDVSPPTDTLMQRQKVAMLKNKATALKWAPVMAWEDDQWDDPSAKPNLGDPVDESYVDEIAIGRCLRGDTPPRFLTRLERRVAVGLLRERGFSLTEIGERMGIDDRQVSRAVYALRIAG